MAKVLFLAGLVIVLIIVFRNEISTLLESVNISLPGLNSMSVESVIKNKPEATVTVVGKGERVFWGAAGGWVYYVVDARTGHKLFLIMTEEQESRLDTLIPLGQEINLMVTGEYSYYLELKKDALYVKSFQKI